MRTKQYRVALADAERTELSLLTSRGKAPARTVTRAHILLATGEDRFDADVAGPLRVSEGMG